MSELTFKKAMELIAELPEDRPAAWGSLTANRLLCHLRDSFDISTGKISMDLKPARFFKGLRKWLVIYSPMPWPKGIKVPDAFFHSDPEQFSDDKSSLLAAIDAFLDLPEDYSFDHPLFGRMNKSDWQRLHLRHMAHHFRQFELC